MLSSNKDYLSIINNLIEEQNYDDALNKIKELQNDDSITLTDEENTSLNNHESLLKDYLKLDLIDSLTEYNTQMQLLLSNPLLENKSFTKMFISLKNYDALLQIELASFNDTKKIIFESMEENIEEAKQPLFTTKSNLERSGMGFTIMESFMDNVEVDSVLGVGTKVTMSKKIKINSSREKQKDVENANNLVNTGVRGEE